VFIQTPFITHPETVQNAMIGRLLTAIIYTKIVFGWGCSLGNSRRYLEP